MKFKLKPKINIVVLMIFIVILIITIIFNVFEIFRGITVVNPPEIVNNYGSTETCKDYGIFEIPNTELIAKVITHMPDANIGSELPIPDMDLIVEGNYNNKPFYKRIYIEDGGGLIYGSDGKKVYLSGMHSQMGDMNFISVDIFTEKKIFFTVGEPEYFMMMDGPSIGENGKYLAYGVDYTQSFNLEPIPNKRILYVYDLIKRKIINSFNIMENDTFEWRKNSLYYHDTSGNEQLVSFDN